MKNLSSVVDSKIEQFHSKFRELKLALQERAIVQTELTVWRVLETVENIGLYFSPIMAVFFFGRHTSCSQVQKSYSVICLTQKEPGTMSQKDASQELAEKSSMRSWRG
jgi:hypothetical protein